MMWQGTWSETWGVHGDGGSRIQKWRFTTSLHCDLVGYLPRRPWRNLHHHWNLKSCDWNCSLCILVDIAPMDL